MGDSHESDMEVLRMPVREWKGWIRNRLTHELEWCIITAGLMGVFRDPEVDHARIVLNLADFDVKPLCEGAKRGSHVFTYVDDVYSIKFVSKRNKQVFYTFGTETEEDFRAWHRALTGAEVETIKCASELAATSFGPSTNEVKPEHNTASRMDSGLGDDVMRSDQTASPIGKAACDPIEEGELLCAETSGVSCVITPPPQNVEQCAGSSDSDSGQSNSTTPDSELADEVPRLRENAHDLRLSRTNRARFSAPVGEFSFWEENSEDMLTKSYSLPMRSPTKKRTSSEGDDGIFDNAPQSNSSSTQDVSGSSATTPHNRRPGQVSSYSDPARKKLGSKMTVKASRLMGRMSQLRSQRARPPLPISSIVSITIDGDLLRKHKSTLLPCFCILSEATLYCYKSKQSEDVSDLTINITKYKLSKLPAAKTESRELDCAFVLTSHTSSKEYVFIAKDLDLARRWYGHLEDILKNLEARQIRAMQSSVPDLRSSGSLPSLNHAGKYVATSSSPGGRYAKTGKTRGSTFKRLALAEEEKRNSIAARMSRASFEDGYGFTEEMSRHRGSRDDLESIDDVEEDETFLEITMDDVQRSKIGFGDPAVSRSMDDIGMTSLSSRSLLPIGKTPSGRTTPKMKRHKRTVPIAASEVCDVIKSGYVDVKKSGSWKRCWCLLTSDRIYLYRKPTDTQTLDMLLLDGYQVHTKPISLATAKTPSRFPFELCHPRVSETHFCCETLDERTAWMAASSDACKRASGEFVERAADQQPGGENGSALRRCESEPSGDGQARLSDGNKSSASSSDASDASPITDRKKQIIEDKYERVKEAHEMEMLRVNTILNQRRMSADVKINAVERKLLQQRKQRKRKKNNSGSEPTDEEEAELQDQLDQLKARLQEVEKESQETSQKQGQQLRDIQEKKDLAFKILEQERKLQKHRKAAQQALQQIVKGISSITPPVGGSRPRFDLIAEEEEGDGDDRKHSMTSSMGLSSSDSMGSLCDPRRFANQPGADSPGVFPDVPEIKVPASRRVGVHHTPKLGKVSTDSSTDSSSSMDSPDVPRHNFDLVAEFTKSFPGSETDGPIEYGSRDKSKSFDSGIADEVDVNSNKALRMTTNGHVMDESEVSSSPVDEGSRDGSVGKTIRTEISEDVLRDIEEFEKIALRALEQASWMV